MLMLTDNRTHSNSRPAYAVIGNYHKDFWTHRSAIQMSYSTLGVDGRVSLYFSRLSIIVSKRACLGKHLYNNNNNNNNHDIVYGAVIMAEPLREFTRFI